MSVNAATVKKTVWRFLEKVETDLAHDLAVPLLDIRPGDRTVRNLSTVFVAALSQQPVFGTSQGVCHHTNGYRKRGVHARWNIIQQRKEVCHLQQMDRFLIYKYALSISLLYYVNEIDF